MNPILADFGLARSSLTPAAQSPDDAAGADGEQGPGSSGGGGGRRIIKLRRAYSQDTFTPCYRAPEVLITPGCYDGGVDIWALGCIFFELIQRLPAYRAMPCRRLFQGGEGGSLGDSRRVVQEMVRTLGTPSHAAIDSLLERARVEEAGEEQGGLEQGWREWLLGLPLGPGSLPRQCLLRDPPLDLEAYDFLLRHLTFSPGHRCTAEEALGHIYLQAHRRPEELPRIGAGGGVQESAARELAATEGLLRQICASPAWEKDLVNLLGNEVGAVGAKPSAGKAESGAGVASMSPGGRKKEGVKRALSRTNPTAPFNIEQHPACKAKSAPHLACSPEKQDRPEGVGEKGAEEAEGPAAADSPGAAEQFGGAGTGGATGLTAAVGKMSHRST